MEITHCKEIEVLRYLFTQNKPFELALNRNPVNKVIRQSHFAQPAWLRSSRDRLLSRRKTAEC